MYRISFAIGGPYLQNPGAKQEAQQTGCLSCSHPIGRHLGPMVSDRAHRMALAQEPGGALESETGFREDSATERETGRALCSGTPAIVILAVPQSVAGFEGVDYSSDGVVGTA